ncbi:MAG: hypothetical protein HY066_09865 [Betaproteobacteria bacterium]|nr:hypothetical protein [Betaproteobacteria bacterium]
MRGSFTNSRFALTLRRWRGRFGISAPRVTVRTHLPWYWWTLSVVALLAIALASAAWIYDAGRRFAGFDRSETEREIDTLHGRTAELEKELARLRSLADVSDSKLQIELTTQQQLTRQVEVLENENAQLKEDLSVFENLALAQGQEGSVSINRLRVEPEAAGAANQYRYHMLVAMQGGRKELEFKGNLQLMLSLQQESKSVMMLLPLPTDQNLQQYSINFKHFRRLDGTFRIPPGSRIKSVEVRLMQGGALKASKSVTL